MPAPFVWISDGTHIILPLPVGPIMAVTRPAGAVPETWCNISFVFPLFFLPFKGMERETVVENGMGITVR